jgi:hypothetical protein
MAAVALANPCDELELPEAGSRPQEFADRA